MNPEPTPTAIAERILSLDVVRGTALLGILIMNMPGFSSSYFVGASGVLRFSSLWDRVVETLRDVICSGKFNSMFSMLFAVGFTLQLQRLEQRDPLDAVAIYCRRLFWLLVFGVIHACIFWTGDVLHMYALLGLVLLALRRCPDSIVIVLMVASALYSPVVGIVRMRTTTLDDAYALNAFYQTWEASNDAAYGSGTFLQAAREHTREMVSTYVAPENLVFNIGFYMQLLTTMLIGLLLGRHQIFQRACHLLPQLRRVQTAALVIGIITGVVFGLFELVIDNPALPTPLSIIANTCYALCRVSLMTCYVAALVRWSCEGRWPLLLQLLALVGRMPLTNYLSQTLIGTFIFYGWGLGWWNQISPLGNIGLALLIYIGIQVPLSAWWLRHHDQGPMEYLWRWLTYGRGTRRDVPVGNA